MKPPQHEIINHALAGLMQREKISPFGESEHRVCLVTGRAGDRLSHLFAGNPAPLAESKRLRRVSACEAVCATLSDG